VQMHIAKDLDFQLFDFSVLNKLSPTAKGTSQAIKFTVREPPVQLEGLYGC